MEKAPIGMNTLWWLKRKYQLRFRRRQPVPIPNVGRNDLAQWCAKLGFRVIVEIGVRTGNYTEVLCKANPQAKIYGIDPWVIYPGYRDRAHGNDAETMESQYSQAREKLAPYSNCTLIRKFSMDAVKDFDFHSIDMVYIDGNHDFQHCIEDIENWSRIVRPGGVISGHDYKRYKIVHERIEVFEAVNEYTRLHAIRPWFVLGARQSHPGMVRENPRSWMWVKG